tara:strand:+ start:102 stop:269 length:168 start_codon:yes stop_codon:yes gene_type:complete
MSTKPKDILILYAVLIVLGAVFYTTIKSQKKDGNIQNKKLVNERRNTNPSYQLGD